MILEALKYTSDTISLIKTLRTLVEAIKDSPIVSEEDKEKLCEVIEQLAKTEDILTEIYSLFASTLKVYFTSKQ